MSCVGGSLALADELFFFSLRLTFWEERFTFSFFSIGASFALTSWVDMGLVIIFLFLLTCTPAEALLFLDDKVAVLSFILSFSDIITLLSSFHGLAL